MKSIKEKCSSRQDELRSKQRIYQRQDLPVLTAQQTKTIIQQLEGQLYLAETDTTTRVIIYELLTTLLRLDDKTID